MLQIPSNRALDFKPRNSVEFDLDAIEHLATSDGPKFAASLYAAEVAGDRQAILFHTLTYLRTPTTAPVGRSRDSLILGAQLAQLSDPATVADLAEIPAQLEEAKVIIKLNDATWSVNRPGSLDDPFRKAQARLSMINDELRAIAAGRPRAPWRLARELGSCGAFHLVEAIASALLQTGNGSYALVAYAASRRHSGDPAAAVSICDRVLTTEMSAAAFVARGAALGDLRRYRAALDSVCLGLALDPNTYAGNAARRAFRMARAGGQNFISALNLACETGQVPPGKNVSLPHFCREMAAGALASAGHRDLVEVALIGARRADDRSLRVRQWCQQNAVAR